MIKLKPHDMKALKLFFGFFLMLAISGLSYGNYENNPLPDSQIKIKGVVIDSISENPIEYATIVLLNCKDSTVISGVITNENGEFVLSDIPQGEFNLRVQFMGFNTLELSNIKVNGKHKIIEIGEIKLHPSVQELAEATVSSERRMVEYKIDKKVINASANIASSGGTAVEILRNNPSVTVDIEDNVNLRGRTDYQVLINGRPSALNGPEAIKQIAAANVDKIEIITNPSASHEAAGSAGIINVILKENSRKGLGAFVNLTGGNDRFLEDANVNLTSKRWNFVLGLSAMDYKIPVYINRERHTQINDSLSLLTESALQYHITKSRNVSIGADFDMNKNNLFSASLNAGSWVHVHDFESKYVLEDLDRETEQYTTSENDFELGHEFLTGNFNYKHLFNKKNHELSANLFYSQIRGFRNLQAFHNNTNADWGNTQLQSQIKADESNSSYNLRTNIDYKLPIGTNSSLETGTQFEYNPSISIMNCEDFDIDNQIWLTNDLFTNNVDFHTLIAGYYATFSQTFNKIEYKIGLRGEYYESLFDLNTPTEVYDYKSLDFFPSVHLSYKPTDKNQAQISYSRRVNRPNAWLMYPAPDFDDIYMRSLGNPDLKPYFTDSYELAFVRIIPKGIISAEAYHRRDKDNFTRLLLSDGSGKLYYQFHNVGNKNATGVEFSLNKSFGKKVSINFSTTAYYYTLMVDFMEFDDVASFTGNVRLNTNTNLNKTTKLQVNLAYNAPAKTMQGRFSQNIGGTIAFRKDFPSINSSLTITAQSPFIGRKYVSEVNDESFTYYSNDLVKSSYYLTFTYRLNNFKRQRSSIDNAGVGEGVG